MRLLLADPPVAGAPAPGSVLGDDELARLYAPPAEAPTWLRSNFAVSLDGAVSGANGRSGTVNSAADHVVFELIRALSDAVVVGAGTLRTEGYGPLAVAPRWREARRRLGLSETLPVVAVSRSGEVPQDLLGAEPGRVLLATGVDSPGRSAARRVLGDEHVLVCGPHDVGGRELVDALADRGLRRLVCEGGPSLLAALLDADALDEVCLSLTPRLVAGTAPRFVTGADREEPFTPVVLVEQDGTVIGRWLRGPHPGAR